MQIRFLFASIILIGTSQSNAAAGDLKIEKLQQLFVSPTAPMIESASINLSGGGVFGLDSQGSWRNHFRFGIGGVGELAFSQQEIFTNIFPNGARLQTKSLKIMVVPTMKFGKSAAVSFSGMVRSADWTGQQSNSAYLETGSLLADASLTSAKFETRFASLYLIGSFKFKNTAIHFGPILTDFRYKNLALEFIRYDSFVDNEERSKKGKGVFFGFTNMVNPSTMLLIDFSTVPRLNLNLDVEQQEYSVSFTHDYLILWGLRYFIHDYVSFDSAVRFYNSKSELSDIQVKLGVNVNLPIKRIVNDVGDLVSGRG